MTSFVQIGDTRYALTPWFPGTSAPTRPGVYERQVPGGTFACWDGSGWRQAASTPEAASLTTESAAEPAEPAFLSFGWRGLAEQADAPCRTCGGHTVVDSGIGVADVGVDDSADLISECPDC